MPREDLFRAVMPGVELAERAEGDDGGPVMQGHFAVFNQWTEINSLFEGNFMERFSPGAFRATIKAHNSRSEGNGNGMQVLFQHGHDPIVGDKPLGPIDALREDKDGAYYEVSLLDSGYVRDSVLPGLRAGLYGASFRFRVLREEVEEEPKPSAANPHGLPERTVKEAEVREFGPVTFPAYAGATAGVRSLTDRFTLGVDAEPDRLRELYRFLAVRLGEEPRTETIAPSGGSAGESHPAVERRDKKDRKPVRTPAPLTGARRRTPGWRL
jgi:HK97 family phage prohead protease